MEWSNVSIKCKNYPTKLAFLLRGKSVPNGIKLTDQEISLHSLRNIVMINQYLQFLDLFRKCVGQVLPL